MSPAARVEVLTDADRVAALAHPIRIAILDALREPNSAAGVAREISETRQKTNYHVKALLDARLLEPAGERRRGNFVEQLYRSVAPTFLVDVERRTSHRCAAASVAAREPRTGRRTAATRRGGAARPRRVRR
jgi:DNA-binding transcriptional ArsR family regulator